MFLDSASSVTSALAVGSNRGCVWVSIIGFSILHLLLLAKSLETFSTVYMALCHCGKIPKLPFAVLEHGNNQI
jgi:hypothetical protein